jgi:choline dehydrogenase
MPNMLSKIAFLPLIPFTQALVTQNLLGSSFGVPGDDRTYDYVVIGGGNAGLTIATRLVEQKAGTVGVIEAGSFYEITNGNLSEVPAFGAHFSGTGKDDWQPLIDWGYQTVPQKGAYDMSLHYARGKTFGGCSARNYMVYQRATEGTHQVWADKVGDDAYTWDKFLPWYKKSVNFTEPDMNLRIANSTPVYTAFDAADVDSGLGHLSVTWSHYAMAFATWATNAFEEAGLPIIPGFLSGKLLGQSYVNFALNAQKMTRESSETSFLRSSLGNPDYTLHPRTMAKKILFDANKKATGVLVDTEGLGYTLSARKEVILSAGVMNSPQLLMVSGVGPAATLEKFNIPVVADRPGVGKNMQDHLFWGISYAVNSPTVSQLGDPAYAAEQGVLYDTQAAGMYTSPVTDVLGWEKIPERLRTGWGNTTTSALDKVPADWPEVEYIVISSDLGNQSATHHPKPFDGNNYATIAAAIVAPQSRGTLDIVSADTYDHPLIDPGYYTHQADVDVAVAAFKRVREFYATNAMQGTLIGEEHFPGPQVQTDAQIEEFVRSQFNTIWHASSTCSMGRLNDTNAVVDSKARVIGVEGLRVVDASAFPMLTPGHLMSTVCKFEPPDTCGMYANHVTDALAEKISCDVSGNC